MTDDVAALVLRDNYFQTQVLSVTGRIAPQLLDAQARFMQFLEKAGRLNRAIEFLPSDEEIAAAARRRGAGSRRRSARCCSPTARSGSTTSCWPRRCPTIRGSPRRCCATSRRRCSSKYATYMARHPLKREIIATHVMNSMINRVGSTFVHRLSRDDRRAAARGRARLPARARDLRPGADVAGDRGARQQGRRRGAVADADRHQRAARARHDVVPALAPAGRRHGAARSRTSSPASRRCRRACRSCSTPATQAQVDAKVARARRAPACRASSPSAWSTFDTLYAALDIAEVAADGRQAGRSRSPRSTSTWRNRLGLPWLREKIAALPGDQHWQMLAKGAMQDDLSNLRARSRPRSPPRRSGQRRRHRTLVAAWQDEQPPRARAQRAAARRTARGAGARCGDAVGRAARVAQPGLIRRGCRRTSAPARHRSGRIPAQQDRAARDCRRHTSLGSERWRRHTTCCHWGCDWPGRLRRRPARNLSLPRRGTETPLARRVRAIVDAVVQPRQVARFDGRSGSPPRVPRAVVMCPRRRALACDVRRSRGLRLAGARRGRHQQELHPELGHGGTGLDCSRSSCSIRTPRRRRVSPSPTTCRPTSSSRSPADGRHQHLRIRGDRDARDQHRSRCPAAPSAASREASPGQCRLTINVVSHGSQHLPQHDPGERGDVVAGHQSAIGAGHAGGVRARATSRAPRRSRRPSCTATARRRRRCRRSRSRSPIRTRCR